MFGDHSFCSCFVGESAGYIWQFKIRILTLCAESIEHLVQKISVDFAPFNFMKSWCSPALRLASYPGSSPCRKTRRGAWIRGYFQTTFCFLQYVLKVMETWTGAWQQGYIFVYHMILGKSLIDIAAHLRVCVRTCACVVCVCMCVRGRSSTSLIQCLVCELEWRCCTCQNHLRFHLYHF